MSTVVISGYFNPIHKGHIDYIQAARELGEELVVIVNNDIQQLLKKGKIIMSESDRYHIVESLRDVDMVVISIDTDRSVIKTLEMLTEMYDDIIFANGGDKNSAEEIPESILAKKYNIKFAYGVGGYEKVDSSSRINEVVQKEIDDIKFVPKPWGYEKWLVNNDLYCGKILHIMKGHCSSYHYHYEKDETFYVLKGKLIVELSDGPIVLSEGQTLHVEPLDKHRLIGFTDVDIIEMSTHHEDSDSIRLVDSDRFDIHIY